MVRLKTCSLRGSTYERKSSIFSNKSCSKIENTKLSARAKKDLLMTLAEGQPIDYLCRPPAKENFRFNRSENKSS